MRGTATGTTLALLAALWCSGCGDQGVTEAGGAPASHTVNEDGVRHAPNLQNPTQYCTSCHGSDLRGSGDAPSCYSCHGKEWN